MSDLAKLCKPFPERYVSENPNGYGSYVPHHVVNQALLATVGPFSFECHEIVRGFVPETTRKRSGKDVTLPALENSVVGVVGRLIVDVDGRTVRVEEAGDCEDPHNWPHDGARMKDAMSDAFKRCCMRLGLGLHLWAQDQYFLHDSLVKREEQSS